MKYFVYLLGSLFLLLLACDDFLSNDDKTAVFPTYSFDDLEEGSEIWNQVSINFSTENSEQLLHTILYVNGDSVSFVGNSESSIIWNSKNHEDGDVTLALGAMLESGEMGELTSIDVRVKNTMLTVDADGDFLNGNIHYLIISDLEGNHIMDSLISAGGSYQFIRPDHFNEESFHVYDIEKNDIYPEGRFHTQVYGHYPFDQLNLKGFIPNPGVETGEFSVNYSGNAPVSHLGLFPLYTGFGYAFFTSNETWYDQTYTMPYFDYSSVGYENIHFLTFEDQGSIKALIGQNYSANQTITLNLDNAITMNNELPLNIPAGSDYFVSRIIGYQDDKYYYSNYIDYSSTSLNQNKVSLNHTNFDGLFSHYEIYRYYEDFELGKGYFNRNKVENIPANFENISGDANLISTNLSNLEISATDNFDFSNTRFSYATDSYVSTFSIFNLVNTGDFDLVQIDLDDIPQIFREAVNQWSSMQHVFTDVVDYTNEDLEYRDYVGYYALRNVEGAGVFDFNGISLFQGNTSSKSRNSILKNSGFNEHYITPDLY